MITDSALDLYRSFEHDAWERAANVYAESFEQISGPFAPLLVDACRCTQGDRVLDIACGCGLVSAAAAALGAAVVGVDYSRAMVEEARRRRPSIEFAEADAESLPYADGSFDCVLIGFGVHHFPSPQRALSEAARVLRNSGRIAFSVWSSSDHAIQQLVIDAIQTAGTPDSSLPSPPHGDIKSEEACTALLNGAGFNATSAYKVEVRVPVPSAFELLCWYEQGTARASALIRSQRSEHRAAVTDALQRSLEQYTVRGRFLVPAVAIFATGLLSQPASENDP